jgi:hypothetical protein
MSPRGATATWTHAEMGSTTAKECAMKQIGKAREKLTEMKKRNYDFVSMGLTLEEVSLFTAIAKQDIRELRKVGVFSERIDFDLATPFLPPKTEPKPERSGVRVKQNPEKPTVQVFRIVDLKRIIWSFLSPEFNRKSMERVWRHLKYAQENTSNRCSGHNLCSPDLIDLCEADLTFVEAVENSRISIQNCKMGPLHLAVTAGHLGAVLCLLQEGTRVDIDEKFRVRLSVK